MWHWFPHLDALADSLEPRAPDGAARSKSGAPGNNGLVIVLALVLLVLVAAFSAALVVSNQDVYELSIFRVLIPVTSAGVYLTGVGAAVLTLVALGLLRSGIRRSRARRTHAKSATPAASVSAGPTEIEPDRAPAPARTSALDLDRPPATTPAERQGQLDEADDLSTDEPKT
jgi:hypothetical protein